MHKDQRELREDEPQSESDREAAVTLPKREAMSVIAPPLVGGLTKAVSSEPPPTDTDQGIDEQDP